MAAAESATAGPTGAAGAFSPSGLPRGDLCFHILVRGHVASASGSHVVLCSLDKHRLMLLLYCTCSERVVLPL